MAVIAGIGFGLFLLNDNYQNEKRKKEKQQAEEAITQKIAIAKQHEASEGKKWEVYYEPDPASKIPIARTASIQSDDGLCFLSVQKRLNGAELTGLNCPEIKISSYQDIEVKFDTNDISQKMDLSNYTDSDGVYIPSYQSGQFSYKNFVGMFGKAKSLAIQIPASKTFWTKFNLNGAQEAIAQLGKSNIHISLKTDALIETAKLCTQYMPRYEKEYGIPVHLLSAIATTESGRYHDGLKIKLPYPWVIKVEGKTYFFDTKEEAIAAVQKLQARGVQSVDVGCMLVNLYNHTKSFNSLTQAFEPENNIAYTANLLRGFYIQTGSWKNAAKLYNNESLNPKPDYVKLVYNNWKTIIDKLKSAHQEIPSSTTVGLQEFKSPTPTH